MLIESTYPNILSEGHPQQVRMAHLACIGGSFFLVTQMKFMGRHRQSQSEWCGRGKINLLSERGQINMSL